MGHSVGCAAPEVKARIGANRGDDMTACKPWTDAENRFLIEHHGTLSCRDIGLRLGRSRYSIENRVTKLRKEGALAWPSPEPKWTEADDRKLIAGYARFTISMLAEDFGRTPEAVRSRLRRLKNAGWKVDAMPRGHARSKQAEQARAKYKVPELSLDAEREALRDEIARYLAAEVNANRLDANQVFKLIDELKNVLAAPDHQLKRYLAMPVAQIVREAA